MPLSVEMTKPHRMSDDVSAHPPKATSIFSNIGREVGIVDGFDQRILPFNVTSDAIEFKIEPDHVHYIQPNKTRIYGRFQVTKADGTALAEADNVAPVNLFPAALFKSISIRCNDLVVGGTDMNQLAYKTYLETMMSYDTGASKTHLKSSLFYPDTPKKFDSCNANNAGYAARKALVANSKFCEFMFPLNLDVLNIDKLFPPGLKMNFMFTKNDDSWCLQAPTADTQYKVTVQRCEMFIRKVKVSSFIFNKHEQSLMKGAYCKYPYKRNVLKKMFLAANQQNYYWQNAFSGPLPSQVFLVMNRNDADVGSFVLNPFNFQHFNMSDCSLRVDGKEIEKFHVDFANGKTQEMLYALYENIGIQDYNGGCSVDKDMFEGGACIASWNLTADKRGAMYEKFGGMDLHLNFKEGLTNRITVILWGIFDDVLRITPDKKMKTGHI